MTRRCCWPAGTGPWSCPRPSAWAGSGRPTGAEVLPGLRELLGADALLLDYLDDHEDPAAQAQRAARGPAGYLFFDWTDACVAHPFLDLATIRRGTAFTDLTREDELRQRLRQAYLPVWAAFEPPGRLERVWELATPLGALDQAVSYRSLATQPPMDPHMAQATAWWLRQVLAVSASRRP